MPSFIAREHRWHIMFIRVDQWWDSVISNAKTTATYKYEEQHDGRMLGAIPEVGNSVLMPRQNVII